MNQNYRFMELSQFCTPLHWSAYGVVGGTASALSCGKFANGAQTAAYGYLFNELGDILNSEECSGNNSCHKKLLDSLNEARHKISDLSKEDFRERAELTVGHDVGPIKNLVTGEISRIITSKLIGPSHFSPLDALFAATGLGQGIFRVLDYFSDTATSIRSVVSASASDRYNITYSCRGGAPCHIYADNILIND